MRIGLLAAAGSIHTIKIANGLAAMGFSITLFSLPGHRDADKALDPSVDVVYLKYDGAKGYLCNCARLKKAMKQRCIEVLNTHYASGYGTLAALAGFQPSVLSVWGSDVYEFPEKSFVHRWLIKRNLSKATAILSTSHVMARRVFKYAPDKPIAITPFGIDLQMFSPANQTRDANNTVTVGIVKTLSPKYGVKELIAAFHTVVHHLPQLKMRLSIYGDGPQKEELERMAEALGLEDKVTFFGRIPHSKVPDALRTLDIFCAPSTRDSESFGVAAVEAMACGIPCVTSDADGFTEVMEDGVTGFIVPKNDVDALANKIKLLAMDRQLRERMGAAGRIRAEQNYDWQENIKTIAQALSAPAMTAGLNETLKGGEMR